MVALPRSTLQGLPLWAFMYIDGATVEKDAPDADCGATSNNNTSGPWWTIESGPGPIARPPTSCYVGFVTDGEEVAECPSPMPRTAAPF
jgi:hypothetical protein